jgi:hypothetical protein
VIVPLVGHDTEKVERVPASALIGVYELTNTLPDSLGLVDPTTASVGLNTNAASEPTSGLIVASTSEAA